MASNLPYLPTANSLITCLDKIKAASTPDRVTVDFVNTILELKGGTGAAIIPYLKKIGIVGSDGTPTELYRRFRNASTGKTAIADAVRFGYKPLFEKNEYFYKLKDTELKDLVIEVTGLEKDSTSLKCIYATLKNLLTFADFEGNAPREEPQEAPRREPLQIEERPGQTHGHSSKVGLNLSYTINLNLPATSDQAVFNAIFKSLKEHLLSNE